MRIVIDLQGAQTESRFRGLGRYTLQLAQAIVRNRGEHEIIIALSGLFPDTIEPIRAAFDGLLQQENIRVWYGPSQVRESNPGGEWRHGVEMRLREAFLANLRPDVIFIPCFCDNYLDGSTISIGAFAPNLKTVIAIDRLDVDSIDDTNFHHREHILNRLKNLKSADLLLVVPPLRAEEVSRCLGLSQERVRTSVELSESEANENNSTTAAVILLAMLEEVSDLPVVQVPKLLSQRPKLAYISPLPPVQSGIADYSAELLPELSCFYDIDVIVNQSEIDLPWVLANCGVRTVDWFIENSQHYDRVLYHVGNSSYHQHMIGLLAQKPGVVVAHDFYIGDLQYYLETHGVIPSAWHKALYESHGYQALIECDTNENIVDAVRKFPVNLEVFTRAEGVIFHSRHSVNLAHNWYGNKLPFDYEVIPLLRVSNYEINRTQARQRLGLKETDFVVCSFGLLGPTKLNHCLLDAWIASNLSNDGNCFLIFVGENDGGDYGSNIKNTIHVHGLDKNIKITGRTDTQKYRDYLAAADMAVQLRTQSRGETSAAVLDAMNYALPAIVNAHGSMAEIPSDAVWMLTDNFESSQLTAALESLWKNADRRSSLGMHAREVVVGRHAPQACAAQYASAIERFHANSQRGTAALVQSIVDIEGYDPTANECLSLAQIIADSLPIANVGLQLLVDVSATCRNDLGTGIQRVVRALVQQLVLSPPPGYRVEPVFLTDNGGKWHYCYARDWTLRSLGLPNSFLADDPVDFSAGDIMLIADFTGGYAVAAECAGIFEKLKVNGIGLHFVVYDLLPIQMPHVFPPDTFGYVDWLQALYRVADSALCISKSVATELRAWAESSGLVRNRPIKIDWFHLGADIECTIPTKGFQIDSDKILKIITASPSFLMVGTIEPRKGYLQVINAFTQLWQMEVDVNLVIVGNEGWKSLPRDMRRTIPEIVEKLKIHPQLGKRLFWLTGVSDEYLNKIYESSICLISASEGEGFGLPLIEAAQNDLPLLVRDIPVFREVAGSYAEYFCGTDPESLAKNIEDWLERKKLNMVPISNKMRWQTWKQSAEQILNSIIPI